MRINTISEMMNQSAHLLIDIRGPVIILLMCVSTKENVVNSHVLEKWVC